MFEYSTLYWDQVTTTLYIVTLNRYDQAINGLNLHRCVTPLDMINTLPTYHFTLYTHGVTLFTKCHTCMLGDPLAY